MSTTAPVRRPSATARRGGYLIAAVINAALLYAVNVSPGRRILPFLTEDTERVLGLVNLSPAAVPPANTIYILRDPPWLRSLGETLTTAISLAATVRTHQVYPSVFTAPAFDWNLVAHAALVLTIIGTAIGVIANFLSFIRGLASPTDD